MFENGEFQDGVLDYSVDDSQLRVTAAGLAGLERRTNEEEEEEE